MVAPTGFEPVFQP